MILGLKKGRGRFHVEWEHKCLREMEGKDPKEEEGKPVGAVRNRGGVGLFQGEGWQALMEQTERSGGITRKKLKKEVSREVSGEEETVIGAPR